MPNIKELLPGAAELFAKLDKLNAREAGRTVAQAVDKALDEQYKDRSERLQADKCEAMNIFADTFKKTLMEDWNVAQKKKAALNKQKVDENAKVKAKVEADAKAEKEEKKEEKPTKVKKPRAKKKKKGKK